MDETLFSNRTYKDTGVYVLLPFSSTLLKTTSRFCNVISWLLSEITTLLVTRARPA